MKRKPHEGTQERRVERAIGFDARRAASAGLGRETRNVGDAAGVRAGVGANAQERRAEKAPASFPREGRDDGCRYFTKSKRTAWYTYSPISMQE